MQFGGRNFGTDSPTGKSGTEVP